MKRTIFILALVVISLVLMNCAAMNPAMIMSQSRNEGTDEVIAVYPPLTADALPFVTVTNNKKKTHADEARAIALSDKFIVTSEQGKDTYTVTVQADAVSSKLNRESNAYTVRKYQEEYQRRIKSELEGLLSCNVNTAAVKSIADCIANGGSLADVKNVIATLLKKEILAKTNMMLQGWSEAKIRNMAGSTEGMSLEDVKIKISNNSSLVMLLAHQCQNAVVSLKWNAANYNKILAGVADYIHQINIKGNNARIFIKPCQDSTLDMVNRDKIEDEMRALLKRADIKIVTDMKKADIVLAASVDTEKTGDEYCYMFTLISEFHLKKMEPAMIKHRVKLEI